MKENWGVCYTRCSRSDSKSWFHLTKATWWRMLLLHIMWSIAQNHSIKKWKLCQLSKVLFSCLLLSTVSLQRLANSHSPGARNDIKYRQLWPWHSHDSKYVICHSFNCQAGTCLSLDLVLVKEEVSFDTFLFCPTSLQIQKVHRWTKYWKSNSFSKYRYLINYMILKT